MKGIGNKFPMKYRIADTSLIDDLKIDLNKFYNFYIINKNFETLNTA